MAPKQKIIAVIVGAHLETHKGTIESLAGVESLSFVSAPPTGEYASAVISDGQVFVSLEGLVDKDAERAKLAKEQKETEGYIASLEAKLGNKEFTAKAPEHVVATMRQNLEDARKKLERYVHDSKS